MIGSTANAINSGNIGVLGGTPREIGFMDRAYGLANGLDQLQERLQNLLSRIDGNGESAAVKQSLPPTGMAGSLSDAEQRLRACMSLIDELHARF